MSSNCPAPGQLGLPQLEGINGCQEEHQDNTAADTLGQQGPTTVERPSTPLLELNQTEPSIYTLQNDSDVAVDRNTIERYLLTVLASIPLEPDCRNNTYLTNGYLSALRMRRMHGDLYTRFDTTRWVPLFVYDVMMLPGSLANLFGKNSENDIIDRMTPALLPGYAAVINPDTRLPVLIRAREHCIRGIVIFGQGRRQRELLTEHYHDNQTRRVRSYACVETRVPQPQHLRTTTEKWTVERTIIHADAWVTTDENLCTREHLQLFNFEHFMTGSYHDESLPPQPVESMPQSS